MSNVTMSRHIGLDNYEHLSIASIRPQG